MCPSVEFSKGCGPGLGCAQEMLAKCANSVLERDLCIFHELEAAEVHPSNRLFWREGGLGSGPLMSFLPFLTLGRPLPTREPLFLTQETTDQNASVWRAGNSENWLPQQLRSSPVLSWLRRSSPHRGHLSWPLNTGQLWLPPAQNPGLPRVRCLFLCTSPLRTGPQDSLPDHPASRSSTHGST